MRESDYKRRLVTQVNALPGGRARRIEDRFAVGVLDLFLKLPGLPIIIAEGKIIDGNVFGPTARQFEEGERWRQADVEALLLGWKRGVMFVSPWTEQADWRQCFTAEKTSYAEILRRYLIQKGEERHE